MDVMAFLGLGSNLGDRLTNLQAAVDALQTEPRLRVTASSRVWETAPVGGPPQPDYLNAVIRVETDLSARDLLDAARRVETRLGRVRTERWGARSLDVDVLLYDEELIDEPELVVPHPRIAQRAFVLLPLLELEPDLVLPDGTRLKEVRVDTGGVTPSSPPLAVRR
ncbi:MAG: 2-amino-4-hydroxy-6-hydroxymethyldihydropteridine diphosphokinase [Actinomycetota bacterium]|nr:2-amino-4-hydroxy-6-hydroxymethyldihydropteridine diphosphokinase [Actinomycetota bacterium]